MEQTSAIPRLYEDDLSLAIAQYRAFANKMPPFYFGIAASKLAVCYTFYGLVPIWMCWGLAVLSTSAAVTRGLWWLRHRNDLISAETAAACLKRATRLLIVFAVIFVSCDIFFYQYADANARMLLFFIFLSSYLTGFYCLMHLRGAALMVGGIILVPFLGLLLYQDPRSGLALALNLICVTATMIFVMQSYFRDFGNLVASKASIVLQRAETERLSDENLRLANLDMLTELPNRRCFFADLEMKRKLAITNRYGLGVGILDLDGFKPINDLHGHSTGDRMLRSVADRLRGLERDGITVYRLGGDEFAFIIEAPECDQILTGLGQRSIDVISQPVKVGDLIATVGCSIGFATLSELEETSDILYDHADFALYHAKRTGRARVVTFTRKHELMIKEQGRVEHALRGADLEEELYLAFQPIVQADSGDTTAFECLARWRSPVLGDVPPATFIIAAEQAGLMTSLTPVLLRKALSVAVTWPQHVRMSFNLSAHDIANAARIHDLLEIIKVSGFDPRRIDMELTETALACNFDLAFAHMMLLKAEGICISLDDFGTGYSSISHLHALPLDKIKIDHSFVKGLGRDPNSLKIVRSLSALCRDMGLDCTVEGVETAVQMSHLNALGCNLIQGYFFSKPMPAEEIAPYLLRQLPISAVRPRQTAA